MNSNTKKLIILIAILVFLSVLMSSVCGISTFGFFRNRSIRGGEQTFRIKDKFSDIKIRTNTSDIFFYRSADNSAKAVWDGPKNMKLEVRTWNNTLSITEKYKLPWFLRFGVNFKDTKLSVYLPKDKYDSLILSSDTGSVRIPDSFRFEKADIETDTGGIEFMAKVSRDLKIESDTGSIRAENISPENLDLKTDTGSISIGSFAVSKDIRIKTSTGRLQLSSVTCRDLEAKSDTGSISLTNVFAGDEFKAKSDTGAIRLDRGDAGSLDLESDTGSITGTLLSDKVFVTKSDTGKIIVPETTTGGICKIETDTGRIEITIAR